MSDRVELAKLAFMGLNKTERRAFLTTFADPPATVAPEAERLLRRATVAARLGHSARFVDRLAADGVLRKIRLPGRARAAGFRESDLLALLAGGASE